MQSTKQRFKATHVQTAALTILFCWKSMQQLPFSWAAKKFLKLTNRITKALHSMQIKCIQNDSTTVPIVLRLNAHMPSSQSIKHWYFYMGVGINSQNNFFFIYRILLQYSRSRIRAYMNHSIRVQLLGMHLMKHGYFEYPIVFVLVKRPVLSAWQWHF